MNDSRLPFKSVGAGAAAHISPDRSARSISRSDICIVGNGAVGKAAALGLAQTGLSVTLLGAPAMVIGNGARPESPSADWDQRVYALNHVARSLLAGLKVWDALDDSRIAAVESMLVKGGAEADAGQISFDAFSARTGALAWIVEDRNLNHALDAALKFAHNVRVVNGRARKMAVDAAGASLELEDGSILSAALLVGADGAQSWVRNQCDIGIDYRTYHQQAIVANFATERPHHGVAHQWFTAEQGIIALLPLPGQRVSLVWSAPETLAPVLLHESLAQLAERLSVLAGAQLGQLTPLESSLPEGAQSFPLALIRSHALVAPRVALIGDAAHLVHPLAGQGMNLGFGDVTALIKVLSERGRHRDCGDAAVLARYARARKEEILLMQLATDGLERLFGLDIAPLRLVRNAGLNLLDKLPVLKRRLMRHAFGRTFEKN
ncbi:FAD-dependent monooxygenase [Glaciimonas immobilis]|uniref:Ubiquinone biosynthesis UbiH/UbiF/VisC/COQ6 family hydroxylase n=1 Tax=Glaciimonas immobilis TaxID=728004 RepID=A0A840RV90_9BURK|nr:FAD-dependent monooxygenase [Glaciimonas immobilis]KAF3998655.1 oxygenase [Glaciimonas immobilis]MBB5201523.1 ubiquinone biosynthesis UbiH/UbiF/VisC/COQ6 family hydroxylase [Glaciimonas immobilis]